MWNINPIRDQAMHLATKHTMTGPMYDFVSGSLSGLQEFLTGERTLLDSLEAKYGGAGGNRDWETVRGMLSQRIAQLESAVAECERIMNAARGSS